MTEKPRNLEEPSIGHYIIVLAIAAMSGFLVGALAGFMFILSG